jgi:hypothetical protein
VAGNLANLEQATAARTAAALARAEAAVDAMLKTGDPITFRGLATRAGVSLDFLYRHRQIRARVEHLRTRQQTHRPNDDPTPAGTDQPSNVIRGLTAQLAEVKRRHHEQISALQQALAAAHGENLLLRRRLGAHTEDHASPPNPSQTRP